MGSAGDPAARPRQPSIYDVAAAAGVSVSTVSRALSKPGRVSFRTAEHVRSVATELGYHADATARTLEQGATSMLAMVVADITNPVFFGMIRGAERTAAHAGYTLLMVETQESEESERILLERVRPAVAGMILTSSRMSDATIRTVAKTVPVVVLNRLVDQVPSVAGDNLRGIGLAVEHLHARGHTSITFLAGPEASWANGMRWRGLIEAGHRLGVRVRRTAPYLPTMGGGAEAARAWLDAQSDAVIAFNDLIAIGFIREVESAGLRVPADVSVIGFDNIRDGQLIQPALTTVSVPLPSLGSAAVNHLLKTRAVPTSTASSVVLPSRLVRRASTGPAPHRTDPN